MIRVLQIVDHVDLGGIQSFIMNTYRRLVDKEVQYDFLVFHDRTQYYEEEIHLLGGRIYKLPSRRMGYFKCRRALSDFFDKHTEYKEVHYQTSSLSFITPIVVAKEKGIPVRIIHSHSTQASGNRIHTVFHSINRLRIHNYANVFLACGKLSAKWMYGNNSKNTIILYNGIDLEQYSYNEIIRNQVRNELNLDEYYVVGHVGRFSAVKNHVFLVELFEKLCEYEDVEFKPYLVLVGNGELFNDIKTLCENKGIDNRVLFLGGINYVDKVLQSFDAFVLPSLYEGFPVSAIEAQASGLPCFVSDTITEEVKMKENVHMLSIEANMESWCDAIYNDRTRMKDNSALENAGMDINDVVDELLSIYKGNFTTIEQECNQ